MKLKKSVVILLFWIIGHTYSSQLISSTTWRQRLFQNLPVWMQRFFAPEEEGYPIIGYTPWASHDNYEWPSKNTPPQPTDQPDPYDRPYGFFSVDFTKKDLPRSLKKGAHYYRDFIKEYFNPNEKKE